jgi:hypothetical protein
MEQLAGLLYWKKSSRRFFQALASWPPAKSVVFAGCQGA